MKTETLIELQRSITQGEWRLEDVKAQTLLNVVPKNQQKAFKRNSAIADYYQIASVATSFCRTKSPSGFEHPKLPEGQALANGKAVALVPELIAEVIKLREALGYVSELLDCGNIERSHQIDALSAVRAALASDK